MTNRSSRILAVVFLLVGLPVGSLIAADAGNENTRIELRDGDRVAFVGGTFIERQQMDGYLELFLTIAQPGKHVAFRNLGWSGDTVWGESRGVFGGPNEGFARLLKDLKQTKPTLIVICYGANEAHAGPAGVENFVAGLNRLLDSLSDTQARFVLMAPYERVAVGTHLPDPAVYNASLRKYAAAMAEVAKQRKAAFVDLASLLQFKSKGTGTPVLPYSDNGLHLTEFGYWATAPEIAAKFGVSVARWQLQVDFAKGETKGTGGDISDFQKSATGFRLSWQGKTLPYSRLPAPWSLEVSEPTVLINGLPTAKYELQMDGEVISQFTTSEPTSIVLLSKGPIVRQLDSLQKTIRDKNELFFHRHRPQNETYLFLFRKHEQGNNAVEIPQFDPLIEAKEKEIAALRQPKKHLIEVKRVD